ncbi:hypothetical protein [Kitasatospora sp. NPDC048538]|uniref:hypothetical protein n=1 Tax=unclassified Kitasatospora TaxID=2633591 RepID=UPI0033E1D7CB
MARGRKKRKRPLAEGAGRPPKAARRRRGSRPDASFAPRTVRRAALAVAVAAPLLLIGLMVLAADPDVSAVCTVLAVLVLICALGGLMVVRTSGWVLWPGVLLGVLLLALPTATTRAEVLAHRAERTEVVITSAHSARDRSGTVHWTCGIRRTDGRPLPHASFDGLGCDGASDVGSTTGVLVDPGGWVPPASTDLDLSFLSVGVYAVAALALLWALLVTAAARRTLRTAGSRTAGHPPARRHG